MIHRISKLLDKDGPKWALISMKVFVAVLLVLSFLAMLWALDLQTVHVTNQFTHAKY